MRTHRHRVGWSHERPTALAVLELTPFALVARGSAMFALRRRGVIRSQLRCMTRYGICVPPFFLPILLLPLTIPFLIVSFATSHLKHRVLR